MSSTQNRLTEQSLNLTLQTKWLGQRLEHYSVLDSTQTLALKYAQTGCEEGLVVVSDKQTAAKGSQSRTWYSNNDQGIWLSFILCPNLPPVKASQLTLLTATVLTQVIKGMSGLDAAIKWPNDVLIGNKKVAGILTETKGKHERLDYAVIGIGLNLNQISDQLNDQIKQKATSLKIETNQSYSKREMIQAILTQFEFTYEQFMTNGFDQVKETWLKSAYRLGENIHYKVNGVGKEGVFLDLSDDGSLIVQNKQHIHEKLTSAEISWF